jgi:hypothetical protein
MAYPQAPWKKIPGMTVEINEMGVLRKYRLSRGEERVARSNKPGKISCGRVRYEIGWIYAPIRTNNGNMGNVIADYNGHKKMIFRHIWVARLFLGKPPKGFDVNFKDGDISHTYLSNLQYTKHDDSGKWRHTRTHGLTKQQRATMLYDYRLVPRRRDDGSIKKTKDGKILYKHNLSIFQIAQKFSRTRFDTYLILHPYHRTVNAAQSLCYYYRIKKDPVRWAALQQKTHTRYARYWARLHKDPARLEIYKQKKRVCNKIWYKRQKANPVKWKHRQNLHKQFWIRRKAQKCH